MTSPRRALALLVSVLAIATGAAWAFDPPTGSEAPPVLSSPFLVASGGRVAQEWAPMGSFLNPAAAAWAQRSFIEASYLALPGFGPSTGYGSGLDLGLTLPRAYGVWSFGLSYLHSPFPALPLETSLSAQASIAKELSGRVALGLGLGGSIGGPAGWSLDGDLGVLVRHGDLGALKEFAWGAALTGLGKTVAPSPYTFSIGASGYLVRSSSFDLGLAADLSFPSFQNLVLGLGLDLAIGRVAFINLGWDVNLREAFDGAAESMIPSFGLSALIPLDRKADESFISKSGWDRSELRPALAARPLYDGIWGISAGAGMALGVVDRNPPSIELGYPATDYELYYMSPNDDGRNDEIVLPLSIEDERYLSGYTFMALAEDGTVVRSIGNKETPPEAADLKGAFRSLLYVKKGIPVPAELTWNGRADSGETVGDGTYVLVVEAVDDNGNSGRSVERRVVVDRTPPAATVKSPTDSAALIFSPDGDGLKDVFVLPQEGSVEDKWIGTVLDSVGTVVRTYTWEAAAPAELSWDGSTDSGGIAPDGVYSWTLHATDRARNETNRRVDNILVNTLRPPVSVAIDMAAFSPNGDGSKDRINLLPSVPVPNGLASWTLSILDKADAEVWKASGTAGDLPSRVAFDGLGSTGKVLAEGSYKARFTVSYVNGHEPSADSPAFTLDSTPPAATVSADRSAFNPVGVADQAFVAFRQAGSFEETWTGELAGPDGRTIRTWRFIGEPDERLSWDGRDEAGRVAADGTYRYRLSAVDRAGNAWTSAPVEVKIDTEKKDAFLSTDRRAFSPNGDGVADTLRLLPEIRATDAPASWELGVYADLGPAAPAGQKPVKSWTGRGAAPASLAWDGKTDSGAMAADAGYTAALVVRFANGTEKTAEAPLFRLDTKAPSIELSAAPILFSPNGDGFKDSLAVTQSSAPGDDWEAVMVSADRKTVRSWRWKDKVAALEWDGTDSEGNPVADGVYRYVVGSTDAAGNKTERTVEGIRVDRRVTQVFLTASRMGISPNGDGVADELRFVPIVRLADGIESWSVSLLDETDTARKTWKGTGATVPKEIAWDGKLDDGSTREGLMNAVFTVVYAKGDKPEARVGPIAVDAEGPRLRVTASPAMFSPDNDGVDDELVFGIEARDLSAVKSWKLDILEENIDDATKRRVFAGFGGEGSPKERLVWDGRSSKGELVEAATDYPYVITVTDEWGNTARHEGRVAVDVLVIREGDRLKIKVPSIVFQSNGAGFTGLAADTVDRNTQVLKRIAIILNRFRDYEIRIEGHANSIAKMTGAGAAAIEREERDTLIPLSTARADSVRRLLVEYGVDPKRLSVAGVGSSAPVVDFRDAENRWKNRRVEFILIKK
ncbi:MAG: OmpA family protein [Spirochaetales bacterium]|nr:OmpA family protein [Spirochaetales bacterium]